MNPRSHQAANLRVATSIYEAPGRLRYVLNAITTAGGKSATPPIYAVTLIPRVADKLCWVVPRRSLRKQAERAFEAQWMREWLGEMRRARASVNDIDPSRGTHGYITTYQAIAEAPDLHRHEFERYRYILVLDEVHHVKEGGDWARALLPLVERCELLVMMTGTLERGDGQRIAFIDYQSTGDGERPDIRDTVDRAVIRYSRSDALAERAILPIVFKHYDFGGVWVDGTGQRRTVDSFDDVCDDETGDAICAGLQTHYAYELLTDCARDYIAYRRDHPTARLLVVAHRQAVAREYKTYLYEQYGMRAVVAVSDDGEKAQEAIERFVKGHADALVTVGMAYEGLDVPGITHLACLTSIRSKPWIEQMFGRLVRVDPDAGPWQRQRGFAYVPDDKWMREVIEQIQLEQAPYIRVAASTEDPALGQGDTATRDLGSVIALDGNVSGLRASELDGEDISREETARYERAIEAVGLKGCVTVLDVMRIEREKQRLDVTAAQQSGRCVVTESEEEQKLRSGIETACRVIDNRNGRAWGSTNREVVRRFRKSRDEMTTEELRAVWAYLNSHYEECLR